VSITASEQRRSLAAGAPPRFAQRICDHAAVVWLGIFFGLIEIAPRLTYALRPLFIRLAYLFSGKIRRSTAANGRRLCGGIQSPFHSALFGRRVVGSFYDFVYDIGTSLNSTRAELAARVAAIHGADGYLTARSERRGAVLLTAHMGSFEVGLAALPMDEKKIHVVFKRDRLAGFERLRLQLRRTLNVTEAAIDDGMSVWMRLREALLNDEVFAVQGDRVMPGQKGLPVTVCGGTILLPTGPFKLALAANSPVIPIFSTRDAQGRIVIHIHKAIDVAGDEMGIERAVNEFGKILARTLEQYPEQWLVLEPAFCEDVPT
jgi:lauroyl/myristoyl acyltransferase